MTFENLVKSVAVTASALLVGCMSTHAAAGPAMPAMTPVPAGAVKNIVFVHGAWADGSSYSKVIPILQARGFHVISVQNPLTSLADDAAATKRAIALQDGPVILVGHSYGGAIISEAGDDPKVAALVYIAAFAPEVGQSALEQGKPFPTPGGAEIRPDAQGFLLLTPKGMNEDFAQDLSPVERQTMVATQGATSINAINGKSTTAAWKDKPSWFVVAGNDRMIAPKQERESAAAMHAQTTEIAGSSHVVMLSHPDEVEAVIEKAAIGAAVK